MGSPLGAPPLPALRSLFFLPLPGSGPGTCSDVPKGPFAAQGRGSRTRPVSARGRILGVRKRGFPPAPPAAPGNPDLSSRAVRALISLLARW